MDYLCAKFGDFSVSFGFIVRTHRVTEADDRYTHATTIGVSKYSTSRIRNTLLAASITYCGLQTIKVIHSTKIWCMF